MATIAERLVKDAIEREMERKKAEERADLESIARGIACLGKSASCFSHGKKIPDRETRDYIRMLRRSGFVVRIVRIDWYCYFFIRWYTTRLVITWP